MVSTRSDKVKFTDGEKVLCYEPDPSKAKVLYDSKVIEVIQGDKSKKKQTEYLIHFQGWNASWDRHVPEEYVLKDIDENRKLQSALAEKSQIKLSIKSNRVLVGAGSRRGDQKRRRRRRLSETIRETIEREKSKKNGLEGSSQTRPTEGDAGSSSEAEDSLHGLTVENGSESDDETYSQFFPLTIPPALKEVLEKDATLINKKNKLLKLPAEKCILTILEDYVKFFAIRYISRGKEKRRSEAKEKEKAMLTLDLCKEIVDGFRVCFDFYYQTLLLYPKEKKQSDKLKKIKTLEIKEDATLFTFDEATGFKYKDASLRAVDDSSLPSKSASDETNLRTTGAGISDNTTKSLAASRSDSFNRSGLEAPSPLVNNDSSVKRLLRSKRSMSEQSPLSVEKDNKPLVPTAMSESGRSTPTTTSGSSFQAGLKKDLDLNQLNMLNHDFKNYTILPKEYRTPPAPIMIYGAIHLLRLFVKLPEIAYRMNMTDDRKKIVLKHSECFLEYLTLHVSDLFPDTNYVGAEE